MCGGRWALVSSFMEQSFDYYKVSEFIIILYEQIQCSKVGMVSRPCGLSCS